MTSQKSITSWRRESDARGVDTSGSTSPGARSTCWTGRPSTSWIAPRGPRGRPRGPGLHHPQRQARRLLRGRRPQRRSSPCETAAEVEHLLRRGLTVINRLAALAIPTVAIIHGACLGGGLELALACRRRVAIASAAPLQAGLPEIHLGLVPAWGGITRLPRTIDREEALDLLLTGRSIGYLRARSLGLVRPARLRGQPGGPPRSGPAAARRRGPARLRSRSWAGILERARERLDDQPGSFPEVQQRLALDRRDRRGARARGGAGGGRRRRSPSWPSSPETRESIAWFFQRKRIPSFY